MDVQTHILKKLDTWQQEGLQWMQRAESSTKNKGFLLADVMGSGKTHQMCALLAASPLDKPTLIVTPTANMAFWRDAIKWIVGASPYMAIPGCTSHFGIMDESIVVASHPLFRTPPEKSLLSSTLVGRLVHEVSWGRIIVDEAHLLLKAGMLSRRTLDDVRSDIRWAICGCAKDGRMPRAYKDVQEWAGASRPEHILNRNSTSTTTLPCNKKTSMALTEAASAYAIETVRIDFATEVEKQLSEKIHAVAASMKGPGQAEGTIRCRQFVACPAAFRQSIEHQAAFGTKKTAHTDAFASILRSMGPLEDRDSLWTMGSKTAYICDIIRAAEPTDKFVVFCDFYGQVDNIVKALCSLDIYAIPLTGRMKITQQTNTVDAFGNDGPGTRVLVATLRISSTGLNLHAANTVILATSQKADPFLELQAASRIDRKGQHKIPRVLKIVVKGTVEDICM